MNNTNNPTVNTPPPTNQGGTSQTNPQPSQGAATSTVVNPTGQDAPNRKFFIQTLEDSGLSPDQVKKILGDLGKGWNEDRVEPILTQEGKDKIEAYDKLNVEKLPFNWEDQLVRLKNLEIKQANFNEIKKELVGWTDTFNDKKPQQVQEGIKQLEEAKAKQEQELNGKIKDLETNLETSQKEKQEIEKTLGGKLTELEKTLNEWTQTFANRKLEEVQKEWADLKKRPDIPISEQEWLDNYSRRQSISKAQEKDQEITKKDEELTKTKENNWQLFCNIRKFLKEWRTHRYVEIEEWPTTIKQSREKIAELLKETEEEWTHYLDNNNITEKNVPLILGSQNKNKDIIARIYQVLAWIKETRTTLDYEKLFERWNNGQEYNEEYDYDAGSLYLLGEYLKVKDFQPQTTTTNP